MAISEATRELFDLVIKEGASDLLISAGAPPVLRVNGELMRTRQDTLTPERTRAMVYELLNEEQQAIFEERKELDFSLALGRKRRFRVNVYYQKQAVTAALRPIPDAIPGFAELGLPGVIENFAQAHQGLVLVTGPAGHGKTTTQAALIDRINESRSCHVITVEDPIEYVHYHKRSIVDQREVGGDTEGFHQALRYVLRQSPDVVLIGEMRDLETIQAALRAAETGHLVLATLHTNDACQTVDRIIDVFPGGQQQQVRFQLAMCLLAIISQRLLPRLDGKGRALACEVLINNRAIGNLIREGRTHQIYGVMETNTREGMTTMDRAIKELYLNGLVSHDEAISHARNPNEIDAINT